MSKSILDEYIKRRQSGYNVYNKQDPVGSEHGSGYLRNAVLQSIPTNQNGQVPIYKRDEWSQPAMVKAPTVTQSPNTGFASSPMANGTENNVLTWDDQINIEIQNAAKKVLEVANRKFRYSTQESPIYSIMRQEYLKEADLAEGRATAAAARNAGGFGSSFAVMAGEEARRQVMEGFYDQEAELYAAARSEFEAEKQSDFDNYLRLIQLQKSEKERAEAEQGEINDVTYAAYASIAESGAFNTSNEAVIRARLENMKAANPDLDVNKVMEMLRKEQAATGAVTVGENGETLLNEANVDAGYQYIATVMQEATGSKLENMKNTLQTALRNGAGGVKLTDAEIDAAMEKYSKLEDAGVRDMQETNRVMYEKALKNPSAFDVTTIGYSAEEAAEMKDAEKKQAILDAAGEAVKRGELESIYYSTWMMQDAKQAMLNVKGEKPSEVAETLAGLVISFEDSVTTGYMSQTSADRCLRQIAEMAKDTGLYTELQNYMETTKKDHPKVDPKALFGGFLTSHIGLRKEQSDAFIKLAKNYWEEDLFK